MTKNLKWRLGKLPTPDEVLKLVNDKLITKEEARDILFNEESETKRDEKSLEEEIKFLRELVEKLSSNKDKIIEVIKRVQVPYYNYGWYQPYYNWCSIGTSGGGGICTSNTALLNGSTTCGANILNSTNTSGVAGNITASANFSDIQTFNN